MTKDVGCSQSAVSKYKQNEKARIEEGVMAIFEVKEMGFLSRKAKCKPLLSPKEKKTRSQRAEEKQAWTVDGRMKVRFRDESPALDKEMMLEL